MSLPGRLPTVLVTAGDPGGIGPEVALKAALWAERKKLCRIQLVGPVAVWRTAEVRGSTAIIQHTMNTFATKTTFGEPSAANGAASLAALDAAVSVLRAGGADAVVTAPVSKTSLHLAGANYPGQTEYFAERFASPVAMMLAGPKLRVVLTSTHVSLRQAIESLSIEGIVATAHIAHVSLSRWLGHPPRLALAALNPHAGEGGRFGNEESTLLQPAVLAARARGVELEGPFPADTLFWRASHGEFDAVICLFHDQGLIPLKLLHFDEGVNVTLGLPIIRTSPDHGTAYDIAGKGIARPQSMQAAIALAVQWVRAAASAAQ